MIANGKRHSNERFTQSNLNPLVDLLGEPKPLMMVQLIIFYF